MKRLQGLKIQTITFSLLGVPAFLEFWFLQICEGAEKAAVTELILLLSAALLSVSAVSRHAADVYFTCSRRSRSRLVCFGVRRRTEPRAWCSS